MIRKLVYNCCWSSFSDRNWRWKIGNSTRNFQIDSWTHAKRKYIFHPKSNSHVFRYTKLCGFTITCKTHSKRQLSGHIWENVSRKLGLANFCLSREKELYFRDFWQNTNPKLSIKNVRTSVWRFSGDFWCDFAKEKKVHKTVSNQ